MPYLNKKSFRCERCGDCCKHITKIEKEDIEKIKSLSYKESDFVEEDPFDKEGFVLKIKDNKCIFLANNDKINFCKIYDSRPEVCRIYPFFIGKISSCKPANLSKTTSQRLVECIVILF